MAVKTITIDMAAYTLLAGRKREGQSFSDVIKEHFGPQPTVGRFLERARRIRVAPEALEQMDRMVQARRREPARAATR
ncbi:MAG: antitoxin VapB family protein [Acidobacteria bacterium]|nr:antitoxin VapB family protein [Acidobacteriota bacterium]